ncbi:gluconokinase [Candidatus Cyanaurora vandensis]|uniref:gluconokinase n=1 Tax=Candidatus Cyanaurora vandensis TaxID=2714958 RepID=UPI0025800E3E|nr:gluconokinase [Candidatus Cyanaurora vandensis]
MIILVMGVVGAGKTTVGQLLAREIEFAFFDADDFHPQANREKLARGIPLTDEDRTPWLITLAQQIQQWQNSGQNVVLACSALKARYRAVLGGPALIVIYLKGTMALLQERLDRRRGHFADSHILMSQLEDLEVPTDGLTVDITQPPAALVATIRQVIGR